VNNTALAVTMILGAASAASAGDRPEAFGRRVTVCADDLPGLLLFARIQTSAKCARIGVKLEWHNSANCPLAKKSH
jgi:hypothetical protein